MGTAVLLGLALAAWQLLSAGGEDGGGGGEVAKPPAEYIGGGRACRYRWTPSADAGLAAQGAGQCELPPVEQAPGAGVQTTVSASGTNGVQSGSVTIRMRSMPGGSGGGEEKPDPYYAAVAVQGPGEVPPGAFLAGNKGVGCTSKPADVHAHAGTGEYVTLTHPDGFAPCGGGRTWPAVPLAEDPGDWTVVFYHVEDDPTKYASIACAGFRMTVASGLVGQATRANRGGKRRGWGRVDGCAESGRSAGSGSGCS
ncbi:hypothetical protein ACFWUZ_20155 [Streptomyces sp. NPDC058646]|uniref:hypothetical protein n=1 Tax=Streptomyces sp. NPDC058646 TaxID=3346574 RepID=UPI0036670CA1